MLLSPASFPKGGKDGWAARRHNGSEVFSPRGLTKFNFLTRNYCIFVCVCARGCMQGTVWTGPEVHEYVLHMRRNKSSMCVCVEGGGLQGVVGVNSVCMLESAYE